MQNYTPKKPENTQISENDSDNLDIPVDTPVAQKPTEKTKKISHAENQELKKPAQKDLLDTDESLEKLDFEKEKAELEIIKTSQEKTKSEETPPRVIVQEKIIEKELSDEEIKKLYKKILLEHLKNAREKKRAIYENNLKLIEQKSNNEKFTPKNIAKDLKVSRRTASRYLQKLFKQGKIMRFGNGKKLFYQIYAR
ncbi:HTH domain-containing protein [Candidatus Parcubacteria bacterium]|nr:HTH domain-containing protein [Candidatus Parcubacteria bacterium]